MTEFSSLQSSAVIFPLGELPVEAHFSTCIVCRKKNYATDPEVVCKSSTRFRLACLKPIFQY